MYKRQGTLCAVFRPFRRAFLEKRARGAACFVFLWRQAAVSYTHLVNRGLRDLNGNGVLTGLTEISEIQSSKMVDGEKDRSMTLCRELTKKHESVFKSTLGEILAYHKENAPNHTVGIFIGIVCIGKMLSDITERSCTE